MRQMKKHGDEHKHEPELEVDQNLSESHKFAPYKDFEGYHSLWVSSVSSKQATKVKRLKITFAKMQLLTPQRQHLKRERLDDYQPQCLGKELHWTGETGGNRA